VDSIKKIIKDGQTSGAEKFYALKVRRSLTEDSQRNDGIK
jgi:hypothetical protein